MTSICFILPGWITKHSGGAEWQTYILSEEFVKNGWSVSVITSQPNGAIQRREYLNDKINYHYYPVTKSKTVQFIIAFLFILRNSAKYYYTRTDDRVFRAACGMICKFSKKKMIYAIAGDDELRYEKFRVNRHSKFHAKIVRFLDYGIVNWLTRKSEHRAHLIIAQTYLQQKALKEKKKLNAVVIRNSYKYDMHLHNKISKEDIVLWIGNFREVKQPKVFIDIANKFTDTKYKFIMIGHIGNYRFENLPSNLIMKGHLSKEMVIAYLSKSKILVNTSITEGFSNTFLEAWANSTFVISLNSNPDNLLAGNLGFCANGAIQLIEEKIDEFMRNNIDINLIEKQYDELRLQFDLTSNFEKLIIAIKQI